MSKPTSRGGKEPTVAHSMQTKERSNDCKIVGSRAFSREGANDVTLVKIKRIVCLCVVKLFYCVAKSERGEARLGVGCRVEDNGIGLCPLPAFRLLLIMHTHCHFLGGLLANLVVLGLATLVN